MSSIQEIYKENTRKSFKLFAKSKKIHINGVHHNIRFFEPYPFITKSAEGKFLKDVDSNKYVDYWMGHWSLILGHAQKKVQKKAAIQLKKGWMYGTSNENAILLSEKISKVVPVAEKIRYASTGTEATMYSVRLARAVTGKRIIAKIDGGWHGYTTDLLKTVNWPFDVSESQGLIDEKYIVSLPLNNLEESLRILESVKKDLAGVLVEPVLGGGGAIPATEEYLKGIQEMAKSNNALFMLDEIVTGFRFRYGCIYPTMKLDPDIVTLGKIVGGGFPIGVICGKDEIMEHANTSINSKKSRTYIGGGTFSANPLSMIAGDTTLDILKNKKNVLYKKLDGLGNETTKMLKKIFSEEVIVTGKGSLFMTHFPRNGVTEINNAADAAKCDSKKLFNYHFEMIARNGIFFLPGKLGAFSDAHSSADVKNMKKATESFVSNLKR
ncbi:MAG: aminotransferase class III-fold pyridoxal phosphate-dependent enzyme [Crenarchaeota archaeon]|nr:aminotransferase class III-fold pyridoxal phosphate-dependent enzyme [Thermoproteota archaeon]